MAENYNVTIANNVQSPLIRGLYDFTGLPSGALTLQVGGNSARINGILQKYACTIGGRRVRSVGELLDNDEKVA